MNQLITNFKNHSISPSIDIESLCNKISNSGIEYDERKELYECLELKTAGIKVLHQTDERYMRYLKGIDIWEIDEVSYEYIRDNIINYLNLITNKENLVQKLKLMRTIDKQLKSMIEHVETME